MENKILEKKLVKIEGVNCKLYDIKKSTNKILKNGAFVYKFGLDGFRFERFDTIDDAVRCAVQLEGAEVLVDGKEIKYCVFDRTSAVYFENNDIYKVEF